MNQPVPFCHDVWVKHKGDQNLYMNEVISAGVNPVTARVQYERWTKNYKPDMAIGQQYYHIAMM